MAHHSTRHQTPCTTGIAGRRFTIVMNYTGSLVQVTSFVIMVDGAAMRYHRVWMNVSRTPNYQHNILIKANQDSIKV